MLIVLGLMLSGIFIGSLLRGKKTSLWIGKSISSAIFALLFLLGISVGVNPQIMENLATLGVEAMLITLGALCGSLLFAWAIYKFLFEPKEAK